MSNIQCTCMKHRKRHIIHVYSINDVCVGGPGL